MQNKTAKFILQCERTVVFLWHSQRIIKVMSTPGPLAADPNF